MSAHPIQVICPDCEQMIAIVNRQASVWAALDNHTCQHHHPRGNTMSAQPLRPVPTTGKRPHPRELVAHDDKRIAKAAQKVLAAEATLTAAWEANSAKAALRAKLDRLKKQLAEIDPKKVRAWAAEQGYDVAPSGQIPKAIMADYLDATSGGAA
jgi:hypothetical protein